MRRSLKLVARRQRFSLSIDETQVQDFNTGPRNLPGNLFQIPGETLTESCELRPIGSQTNPERADFERCGHFEPDREGSREAVL